MYKNKIGPRIFVIIHHFVIKSRSFGGDFCYFLGNLSRGTTKFLEGLRDLEKRLSLLLGLMLLFGCRFLRFL